VFKQRGCVSTCCAEKKEENRQNYENVQVSEKDGERKNILHKKGKTYNEAVWHEM